MNLLNFNRKTDEDTYKKLEEKIQLSLSMNDMPLTAMTMLSICQASIANKISVKDASMLFSKYLPFGKGVQDERIKEIIELGSSITTNKDPDESMRRIRDIIKTL